MEKMLTRAIEQYSDAECYQSPKTLLQNRQIAKAEAEADLKKNDNQDNNDNPEQQQSALVKKVTNHYSQTSTNHLFSTTSSTNKSHCVGVVNDDDIDEAQENCNTNCTLI
jgi:activator of HSP90 ATPase